MNLADFEAMVRRLCDDVPPEFLDGIAAVEVSSRVVPHPIRADVYTLGECIPLPGQGVGAEPAEAVQSRVVLYHGSFQALARLDADFDWRAEAWETLTHELRHHLEWRARAPTLEAFDEAVEQNLARHEGGSFDPLFYRDGEPVGARIYRLDDDYFLEQVIPTVPSSVTFEWHGVAYRARLPRRTRLPAYIHVTGVDHPPPGDLVVVLRRKAGLRALFERPIPFQATVEVVRTEAE